MSREIWRYGLYGSQERKAHAHSLEFIEDCIRLILVGRKDLLRHL